MHLVSRSSPNLRLDVTLKASGETGGAPRLVAADMLEKLAASTKQRVEEQIANHPDHRIWTWRDGLHQRKAWAQFGGTDPPVYSSSLSNEVQVLIYAGSEEEDEIWTPWMQLSKADQNAVERGRTWNVDGNQVTATYVGTMKIDGANQVMLRQRGEKELSRIQAPIPADLQWLERLEDAIQRRSK